MKHASTFFEPLAPEDVATLQPNSALSQPYIIPPVSFLVHVLKYSPGTRLPAFLYPIFHTSRFFPSRAFGKKKKKENKMIASLSPSLHYGF
jgi:hypothetical protein